MITIDEDFKDRLRDFNYVLSSVEINNLKQLCYLYSNTCCPLSSFFNDICLYKSPNYNKNQAYKDLWLIALIVFRKWVKIK